MVRRNVEIQKKLVGQKPVGVHKMSGDEAEMFFLDYWQFADAKGGDLNLDIEPRLLDSGKSLRIREYTKDWTNNSVPHHLSAPFSYHTDQRIDAYPILGRFLRSPRAIFSSLDERSFQCPNGTSSCTSINRPNSCCATGETCELITDTGLGDVGCCIQGQTCSEQVTNCQSGYQSCPGSSGGGCCIPGYTCAGVGCRFSS